MENILPGRVLNCGGEFTLISVFGREMYATGQAQPNEKVNCCVRPENVAVYAGEAGAVSSNKNVFAGTVTQIYSMGPFLKVTLDCGFPLESIVTQEAFTKLELSEGKQIYAWLRPASIHLMHLNNSENRA